MSFLGQDEQIREYQMRFRYLYIALGVALAVLIARLWYLQVMSGEKFREYSEENRIKRVKISSPRGMIFDRNKKLLVDNRPAFDLEVTPQELYASTAWKANISRLARMIKMPEAEIFDTLEKAKGEPAFLPVRIKQDLNSEEVAIVEAHRLDLPGVNIQVDIKRTNLYRDLAAHLMGYIGEIAPEELPKLNKGIPRGKIPYKTGDVIGKFGLESRWESTLRGIDGEEYMEVDALGYRKKSSNGIIAGLETKPSVPGRNLILTLDQDLQLAALDAFEKKYKDKIIGAMIAINPKTGEILAALSQPSFDPTEFSRGVSPQLWKKLLENEYNPLRDKTIQDHYSPGSTFKAITAIAGLEEKVIDEHSTFACPGSMRVGNRVYSCWRHKGHGYMNVVQALTQSCDVFFYKLGQKLGIDTIAKYATMLGFGRKTGVNLAHEEPGLVPTEAWKKKRFGQEWIPGETLSCAIGQSYMLVTPLQLVNAYAAIATDGFLYKPYIVKYIESSDGRIMKEFSPELLSKAPLSKKTMELVHRGLWGVINSPQGTTYNFRIPGIDAAGKTGSTQIVRLTPEKLHVKCESMPFDIRDNGLFVAYAPPDDPSIAVAVVAEHACHGASGAAPIALAVIKAYLQKYLPERYSPEAIKSNKTKSEPQFTKAKMDEEDVRLNDLPPGAPVEKPGTADE